MESENTNVIKLLKNETSETDATFQPTTESSYLLHPNMSQREKDTSTICTMLAAQPSFKKLFLSESRFPKHLKSNFARSRLLNYPFRWSRNKSSNYLHQPPTVIQINAGKRVLQKYRKFARNVEYKRLHSIIPSLAKRRYASKARILHEAIKYIDTLHQKLVNSIRTKGLPPILQKLSSESGLSKATSNDCHPDHHGEGGSINKNSVETIETQSPVSTISNSETISLIQSALQPQIERRLDARRKMDRLAIQTLIQFSDSHSRTNQAEQIPLSPKEQGSNPK